MSGAGSWIAMALAIVPLLLIVHSYAVYPAILWLLTVVLARGERVGGIGAGEAGAEPAEETPDTAWPRVSVILAAHDEQAVLAARLSNLLALDYPPDRLEVLVGSDGSTDGTCRIAAATAASTLAPRVRLAAFRERRGKAAVLNDLVASARGEIVVLTDANTVFETGAVRRLVMALRRRRDACAAVGRLDLVPAGQGPRHEGAYWRYETWLKSLESRFGCVLGANGAIYAMPRALFRPLPQGAIVDDLLAPMLARLATGGEIVFAPEARAAEEAPARARDEFSRRVRIGAGNVQALRWTWRLLAPRHGMFAFAYLSHKVLRWACPWLMLVSAAASLGLLDRPAFTLLLCGQAALGVAALVAPPLRRIPVVGGLTSATRYFLLINAALLLGALRCILGRARPTWSSAPRVARSPARR